MNVHNQILMNRLKASPSMESISSKPSSTSSISSETKGNNFISFLNNSISSLEEGQLAADQAIQGLVTGEAENLHEVMIQTEEAKISLELAVQLRNKAIEAMNEMKNMQF